jgi:hypothetical protein
LTLGKLVAGGLALVLPNAPAELAERNTPLLRYVERQSPVTEFWGAVGPFSAGQAVFPLALFSYLSAEEEAPFDLVPLKGPWPAVATEPPRILGWMESLATGPEPAEAQESFLRDSLPLLQTLSRLLHFEERPIRNARQVERARILASTERIPNDFGVLTALRESLSAWLAQYRRQRARWRASPPLSEAFQQKLWGSHPSADARAFIPLEEWHIRLHSLREALVDPLATAQGRRSHLRPQSQRPLALSREAGKYHQVYLIRDEGGTDWVLKVFHFQEHAGGYVSSGVLPHLSHLIGRNVLSYRLGERLCPGMPVPTWPCLVPDGDGKAFALGIRMARARGLPFSHYWKPRDTAHPRLTRMEVLRKRCLSLLNQVAGNVAGEGIEDGISRTSLSSGELKELFLSGDATVQEDLRKRWESLGAESRSALLEDWKDYGAELEALPQRLRPGALVRNLIRLQWLDALLFQGDRHYCNFYVEPTASYALQLIDQDQCLGPLDPKAPCDAFPQKDFERQMGVRPEGYFGHGGSSIAERWVRHGGKSVAPLPPLIDATTAVHFEYCRPESLEVLADGWLLPVEIAALRRRLRALQRLIAQLRRYGWVLPDDPNVWESPEVLARLERPDPVLSDPIFPSSLRIRDSDKPQDDDDTRVLTRYQKLRRERDREQRTFLNLSACLDLLRHLELGREAGAEAEAKAIATPGVTGALSTAEPPTETLQSRRASGSTGEEAKAEAGSADGADMRGAGGRGCRWGVGMRSRRLGR